jgi:hypothetical protein
MGIHKLILRGMNMDRRILELAMEALLQKRAQIDREIAEVSAQLGKSTSKTTAKTVRKRRKFTAAERKSMSQKMKSAWAKRKKEKDEVPF